MKKLDEMITLIGNMFTDTYVAGDRKDLDSFRIAKAQREHLYDEIRELYAELEMESYRAEQNGVELKKAYEEIDRLNEDIDRRMKEKAAIFNGTPCPGMKKRLSKIYGSKLTEEVPDHHDAFDAMFPGCTPDDLPFPDVAVAGLGPATTEASAEAEGEAAPASEVEGSDE